MDLISDRIEKMATEKQVAGIPIGIKKIHQEYKAAGGKCPLDEFLSDIAKFLEYKNLSGKDIAKWDMSIGPESKK